MHKLQIVHGETWTIVLIKICIAGPLGVTTISLTEDTTQNGSKGSLWSQVVNWLPSQACKPRQLHIAFSVQILHSKVHY
jgi:hypothetical protein